MTFELFYLMVKYLQLSALLFFSLFTAGKLFAADRYFVYNNGDWFDATNWSDVSGGATGFTPPTTTDNVFFDVNSFTASGQAVFIYSGIAECNNMSWSGVMNTPQFLGTISEELHIYGNATMDVGIDVTTLPFESTVYFKATSPGQTVASNGFIWPSEIRFDGAGGEWTITTTMTTESDADIYMESAGGSLTLNASLSTADLFIQNGNFTTNSNNVTCSTFRSSNANVRSISLGNSTIQVQNQWNLSLTTNLTINTGTATIAFMVLNASGAFYGGNLSYYRLRAANVVNLSIYGNNTFNKIYVATPPNGGLLLTLEISKTQTIIDSLYLFGTIANRRVKIRSSSAGTQGVFSKASGKVCCNWLEIRDNNATGGAAYFAGANSINMGNVSGWTFSACPLPMAISLSKTDVSCNGTCTGTATVTVTPGTPPYTYAWSMGATTSTITGLCPGTYSVTVIDWVPDTLSDSITITEPATLIASINTFSNITCNGTCNGTETVTVSGGTPSYTYLWNNGQTNSTATGLCAGVAFTVTVTDSKGCTATATRTLTQPAVLNAAISSSSNASCFGVCDGQVTATAAGGTPGYTFVWDDPPPVQSTATATALCAGTYNVLVTDTNGCQAAATVIITQPPQLTVNISSSTNITCAGLCNGGASSAAAGGSPPYTYLWDNGEKTAPADSLCAGNHVITVTDSKGCTATDNVTITEPAPLTSSVSSVINVTCFGSCNGSATINPSGGTPPYTYAWSGGACTTCQTNTILCAITYFVTVTDNKGCTNTNSATIAQPTALTADITYSTNANCFGACSGMAGVSASGGTPPYTYLWDDPLAQTNDTASGLCAGFYTVTLWDNNGCDTTDTVSIIEPAVISLTTNVSCSGLCDGIAVGTPSGGTPPYIFQWYDSIPWVIIPGETDSFMDSLCTGTYCLITSDNNGCPDTTCMSIDLPSITTSDTLPSCPGDCDGKIVVTAIGGSPPYTYEWRDTLGIIIDNDSILGPVCAGKYYIYITNSIGCLLIDSVNLFNPAWLTASITSQTNITCNGQCNGSVTVTPTGGSAPYTYSWSNGDTGPTADSLCAGSRTVTVTDAQGCDTVITATITQPTVLTVNIVTVNNVTCGGACNGNTTVTGGGGTPSYSYLWSGGQTTGSIAGLCPGNYTVTVTDSKGCTGSATITITEPSALTVSATGININCAGVCTGQATATVSGGVLNYTYVWNDPLFQSTSTATGLCVGTYTVTVTDGNLCTQTGSVTITQPFVLAAVISSSVNPLCGGLCTGQATVTPGGGSPGYGFLWSQGGQTTALAINLCAGTHTVTVTDSKGCTTTASVVLTAPPVLIASMSDSTGVTCNGDCDGDATVTIAGGTPGYTYLWGDPGNQTTSIATGLCGGIETITVTDANGCTDAEDVVIQEPLAMTVVISAPGASCGGICDVTATTAVSGGTPAYTYQWDDPGSQTGSSATGLCAGNFNVTVTDSRGCTATDNITVTEPGLLILDTLSTTQVGCSGDCSGQAEVFASGGTPAYTYSWNNGDAGPIADSLCSQVYGATVTDANGCTAAVSVPITGPGGLTAFIESFSNASCYNVCDGTAELEASGGTPPYTIQWMDGSGNPIGFTDTLATGLCDGKYEGDIYDNNGCLTRTDTALIVEPPVFTVAITGSTDVSCNGICTGTATATVTNGSPPLTYLWSNGDAAVFADSLCAGSYTITVTDAAGCTATASVSITEPSAISINITPSDASCSGSCDGQATASASGGTGSYTYSWSNSDTGNLADTLCTGSITVTVTDGNGCTAAQTATINEPAVLLLTFNDTTSSTCSACNGDATVSGSGGTPPYTFTWSNGDIVSGAGSSTADTLCISTYTVTLTDANGCTATLNIVIAGPGNLSSTLSDTTHESCSGACDGGAQVSVTGGISPYTYTWFDGIGNIILTGTDIITNLCPGNYSVETADATGCITTVSFTINGAPLLTFSDTTINNITCNGLCDGSVSVTPSGGTPPYTYLWSPGGETISSVTGLCAGTYGITVTDANGCTLSVSGLQVTEPLPLSVTGTENEPTCNGYCDGDLTALVSGGTPPYTYVWSTGGSTSSINLLCAGIYSLTLTDGNGCTLSGSDTVFDPGPVTIDSFVRIMPSCAGTCDGIVTVYASGGSGSYSYSWSSGGTSSTESGLCDGTYTVTVTDDNGCGSISGPVPLTDPSAIGINITSVNIACGGACTGQATVNAGGGSPPYSFLWSAGAQTDQTITGLCAGTYTVTITDANGCTGANSKVITANTPLSITLLTNNPSSCLICDGVVQVVANGGVPPYSYQWNDPASQTTETATALCASTYNVTATDDSNCTAVLTIIVTGPNGLTSQINSYSDVSCFGVCDGQAVSGVTGGTAPYMHQWYDLGSGLPIAGATDTLVTNLCAGDYSDTITDGVGCKTIAPVTITGPAQFTAQISDSADVMCAGVCDGSATVTASGGVLPYTYLWSNGAADTTATGLCGGTWCVTVTSSNGCGTTTQCVTIDEPVSIVLSLNILSTISCYGYCTGSAEADVSGGSPPYSFQWNPAVGSSADTIIDTLCAGTYYLTVTDANNCTVSDSVIITQPAIFTVIITDSTMISCNGMNNGTATATVTGGTPPLTYLWNNGDTGLIADSLPGGSHCITVTDAAGCTVSDCAEIVEPFLLAVNFNNFTNVACDGLPSGSATASTTGGTLPYSFSWNIAGPVDSVASGLYAGTYVVTVTDNNGCTDSASITLSDTSNMAVSIISVTNIACKGQCTGSAEVTGTGSVPPYTYQWSNSDTDSIATGLCSGTYDVTVFSASNCVRFTQVTITQPDSVFSFAFDTIRNSSCGTACTGSVDVSATGGNLPYTFVWSIGDTVTSVDSLCPGTYYLTVSDSNSCVLNDSVIITGPAAISVAFDTTTATCNNTPNGAIDITVSGGVIPFTFLWSNGNTSEDLVNIYSGIYIVSVTDSINCTGQDTFTVSALNSISVTTGNDTSMCAGETIILTANSSPAAAADSWYLLPNLGTTVSTDTFVSVAQTDSGSYTYIFISSTSTCSDTDTVTITVLPVPVPNASAQDTSIIQGEITQLSSSGGGTYDWTPGTGLSDSTSSVPAAWPIATTTYTIIVTVSSGCSGTDSVTIYVSDKISIPNGISPNGDGKNDLWEIPLLNYYPDVSVEVYNRWGELIFESPKGDRYANKFTGTYKGKALPAGTYYFIINFGVENVKPITGPVTILR
ncbi:MAG: gliding motility-associated C-terminal domain-containing protein [Bacteroidetes bacterium]|nr:gliding motility-associated C-terminal domain-containing protein [Bacteroidota bacterium]